MAAEAATSRALTAEEKILELEGLVASLKTRCNGAPIPVQLNCIQEHRYSNINLDSSHNPMTIH